MSLSVRTLACTALHCFTFKSSCSVYIHFPNEQMLYRKTSLNRFSFHNDTSRPVTYYGYIIIIFD